MPSTWIACEWNSSTTRCPSQRRTERLPEVLPSAEDVWLSAILCLRIEIWKIRVVLSISKDERYVSGSEDVGDRIGLLSAEVDVQDRDVDLWVGVDQSQIKTK